MPGQRARLGVILGLVQQLHWLLMLSPMLSATALDNGQARTPGTISAEDADAKPSNGADVTSPPDRRRQLQPSKGPGNEICTNPGPRPSGDISRTDRWAKKFHIFDWSCDTNDPNGPVFDPVHRLYHVFYQRHIWEGSGKQHETARGPVWGHVASADLVHWTRLPTALWNDKWYD